MSAATIGEVRLWAQGIGFPISPRGNLPQRVLDRWDSEYPDRPVPRTLMPLYLRPEYGDIARGSGLLDWIYCHCGQRMYRHSLLAKLKPTGYGCSEWTGQRDKRGYGRHCHKLVNRALWEMCRGPLLPGIGLLHTCDNPPCSLLNHVYEGTQVDNARDRAERGPAWGPLVKNQGENAKNAKLTDDMVREIRARWAAGGVTKLGLSREYPVTRSVIQSVIARRTWRHVQ